MAETVNTIAKVKMVMEQLGRVFYQDEVQDMVDRYNEAHANTGDVMTVKEMCEIEGIIFMLPPPLFMHF